MRLDAILQRLLKLHPNKLIDLKLDRVERLLNVLGRPQDNLPPTIHVAGTNGKGSSIAHLRFMLEAAGKKTHVYNSPHLVRFNERIRLGGTLVGDKKLNDALKICEKANDGKAITYFEITTVAAIYLFAKEKADYLLLEVGLGGRFDATNVIDNPLCALITPVSKDHEEFLGNNLSDIAFEKAGILKKNCPAIIARQPAEALGAIVKQAKKLEIKPYIMGQDFDGFEQNGRFVYQDENGLLDLALSNLKGSFQTQNATLAIATIRHLKLGVSEKQIALGLRNVVWAARFMPILSGELRDILPISSQLWLDGGHNEAGARVLKNAIDEKRGSRPLIMIMAAFANKDIGGFLEHFKNDVDEFIAIDMLSDRASISAKDLAKKAKEMGFNAKAKSSIKEALYQAAKTQNAFVIICGSLHLAGDFLAQNKTPPE